MCVADSYACSHARSNINKAELKYQIATNITGSSATLNWTVNPGDLSATVYFQYGTTTSYGSNTASQTIYLGQDAKRGCEPAITSSGPGGAVTAASCCSFSSAA